MDGGKRSPTLPPSRCDVAVIGGGILGLALARELIARNSRRSICVLEREAELALHQSARNSGVIHAGIYYTPGSLKARLCVEGARELYRYCEEHGIPHRRCGKLILALDRTEVGRLGELERRGRENGVRGLRLVGPREIAAIEPHANALAGLHSPDSGVTDFRAIALSYARDILDAGGTIATGCKVTRAQPAGRALRLTHAGGALEARNAVFCAGAWSDRLAVRAGATREPRIIPFRGEYLRLAPDNAQLLNALVYPVPDPRLPFLGVHLTRRIHDDVLIGPTALIAAARDGYALARLRPHDVLDTLAWPGTWRLAARAWSTGARELHHALCPQALLADAARYIPALDAGKAERDFAGVRAQALSRAGVLVDDFAFSATERALHVRNAPSPAATASLAIARALADRAERDLSLRF